MRDYAQLLLEENERQNLISRASVETLWDRHILDSLQLLNHGASDDLWLDVGSGPGLPGIVLAIAGVRHITLVEPRRLRTDFLARCCDTLGLSNVTIVTGKAEQLRARFDVITARAVASLDKLFAIGVPLMSQNGRWVLPKGRSAEKELEEARVTWQGDFRLVPSQTDPDARILVAQGVRRRTGRG
ncbi:16S rRNA (guanine527-N7)-methyltransferase [Sphingomonas kaistensis]|uniref:Ribosomal RNA small subunit methyltransferase G n=1 Tax=Sphingomonas kaistensis TaxID=298708 RepID=A0A7X5Y452_9SPHN|nr:16S rRNA (guanine(527)-N(7))-methyltransferase RsmG [Sphingomonas kaistensis]NJC04859.1 16S rRNA (guanine527-N7)-methyltransferase [Sphingomonas kaistensis]